MDYSLTKTDIEKEKEKGVLATAWRRLVPLMAEEKRPVIIAIIAILVSSTVSLVVPIIIAHIVDVYIVGKNFHGVLLFSGLLGRYFYCGAYFKLSADYNHGRRGQEIAFQSAQ